MQSINFRIYAICMLFQMFFGMDWPLLDVSILCLNSTSFMLYFMGRHLVDKKSVMGRLLST